MSADFLSCGDVRKRLCRRGGKAMLSYRLEFVVTDRKLFCPRATVSVDGATKSYCYRGRGRGEGFFRVLRVLRVLKVLKVVKVVKDAHR